MSDKKSNTTKRGAKPDKEEKKVKPVQEKKDSDAKEPKDEAKKEIKKSETAAPEKRAAKKKTAALKRSKRYLENVKLIDKTRAYPFVEAIDLAKKTSNITFDGALEIHIRIGIDVKKGDQQVRGAIQLPFGTGKSVKIAAIVPEDKEGEAKEAGADIVGGQDIINAIKQTQKIDFDVAVTVPAMMPKLAAIAKILGPKGLMPSPKNETITTNLKKTINELKKGKINFKNDDSGNIHAVLGKVSFDADKLTGNFYALYNAIKKAKPASSKGVYIKNISINATMGPGIKVLPE